MERRQFIFYLTAIAGSLLSNPARSALSLEEVQSAFAVGKDGKSDGSGTDFLKLEKEMVSFFTNKFVRTGLPRTTETLTYFKDNLAQQALQSIYLPLTHSSTRSELKWQVFLANSKNINAFTYGGGMTIVQSELIKYCKTETVLASVLAHEIGHIENKHAIRRMMSNEILKQFGLSNNQKVIDEVYALKRQGGDISASFMMKISLEIFYKNFKRMWEHQADAFILKAFSETGYELGMASHFFRVLLKLFGDQPQGTCMYSSHPEAVKRIKRIDAIANTMTPVYNTKVDSDAFRYLKNKIGHIDV